MRESLKRTLAAAAAAVLMLFCSVLPAAAAPAAGISIVCSCTVNGQMTQAEGFNVAAFDELGQPITTAEPGQKVLFRAKAPDGFYIAGWSWAASGDDMTEIPEIDETISDSMDEMTLIMSDDPFVTEMEVSADFLPEPPVEGPVKLKISAVPAPGTPAEIMDQITLYAQNIRLKDIESAEPGQVIIVGADVPDGYHVREWRAVAGDMELPLTSDGLNETEFEVPDEATDSLAVEAIIEPGLSLLLDLTIDGIASEEYDVRVTAVDENGQQVHSINVGQTVTISTRVPETYTLETTVFFAYPEDDTLDLSPFLTVTENENDPHSVNVTLHEMPPTNGIVAVMVFSQPAGLSIITVPENGGTIAVSPDSPEPGETVHVQATAADGFILDGWLFTVPDAVSTEDAPDEATFTMPDGPVTVEADFLPARDVLEGLIADALEIAGEVAVSDDGGAGLSPGEVWTTPQAAQTFTDAIDAAQAALTAEDSDIVQAVRLLQAAYDAFTDSVQSVPSTEVLPEITEADGIRVVRGLALSPDTGTAQTVKTVAAALGEAGVTVQITSADGDVLSDDATCATGMIARELDSDRTAALVVWGDVLGTGKESLSQLTRTASAFTGTNPLEGPYFLAADFDGSGKVDLTDLVLASQVYTAYMTAQQAAE